jgi:hypothetical protein
MVLHPAGILENNLLPATIIVNLGNILGGEESVW